MKLPYLWKQGLESHSAEAYGVHGYELIWAMYYGDEIKRVRQWHCQKAVSLDAHCEYLVLDSGTVKYTLDVLDGLEFIAG